MGCRLNIGWLLGVIRLSRARRRANVALVALRRHGRSGRLGDVCGVGGDGMLEGRRTRVVCVVRHGSEESARDGEEAGTNGEEAGRTRGERDLEDEREAAAAVRCAEDVDVTCPARG